MQEKVQVETTRYESLPWIWKVFILILWAVGIGFAACWVLHISIPGLFMIDIGYYYLLIALFSSTVFLILPAHKGDKRLLWYDIAAAALTFGIGLYLFLESWGIAMVGWTPPSSFNLVLGVIFCLLLIEGGRRFAGTVFFVVCMVIALYPLVASHMPGVLYATGFSLPWLVGFQAFSTQGVVGLPAKVMGDLLIGFLVFAGVLIASGAGDFFLDLSICLLGRFRGGPAKVAVVSSGLFGSLSGSTVSNVAATGSVTIPVMKRTGYPPYYAGAIEACASTGGAIMPPVMGAVAFIMAILLEVEYVTIILVAAIPAILYYYGLLMQVDAHAAKVGLSGLPKEEIPSFKTTFKKGWPFIFVFVFLLWGLLYMRWEAMAPFYASGLMVLLSFTSKKTMMTPRRIIETLALMGKLIVQSMAVIIPVGFIICGLTITGLTCSLVAGLVNLGGGSVFPLLLIGAVACYVMGMAGLIAPAYIFLAVTLAPALVEVGGINVLAAHLFIVYYSILADITPPVAIASFIGASIAGAKPMQTAWQSMRLGAVIYFIPFFFVFNPALILQGPISEAVYLFVLCLVGIGLIAGGIEGYLWKVGALKMWTRFLLIISGFLIALPEWKTTIIGVALLLLIIGINWARKNVIKLGGS